MLRRYGEDIGHAEAVKLVSEALPHFGVDLIDGQRDGLAQALQHLRQIAVAARDFGAAVHQKDDMVRGFECVFRLFQDLGGYVLLIMHDDAASVDQFEVPAIVFGMPVKAVARDAWFVPDDGAPLSSDSIEEGGLSD